jgi:hypothetical protein
MSDYARAGSGGATHFGDKDDLSTGDGDKVIVGSQFDDEFNAILTAVATKFDTTTSNVGSFTALASQAEAQAGTNNTKIMTPLRAEEHITTWAAENASIITDLQALADPGADILFGWDESDNAAESFTMGNGISITTNAINIDHDAADNFVADEHIAHSGVNVTAGAGMTGGGSIDSTVTLNVVGDASITVAADSLGLATGVAGTGLTLTTGVLNVVGGDGITANANDIALSAAVAGAGLAHASGVLSVNAAEGLEVSGDNVTIADQSVSATVPIKLTAGTLGWDSSSITEITGPNIDQAADGFLVDNAGVLNVVPYDAMAIKVKAGETTGDLTVVDANTVMEFDGTATLTIKTNAVEAGFEIGAVVILVMDHASQVLTVQADSGVVLNSVFHPGGTDNASDTVVAGGTAALIKIGTDEWKLSGDIIT